MVEKKERQRVEKISTKAIARVRPYFRFRSPTKKISRNQVEAATQQFQLRVRMIEERAQIMIEKQNQKIQKLHEKVKKNARKALKAGKTINDFIRNLIKSNLHKARLHIAKKVL